MWHCQSRSWVIVRCDEECRLTDRLEVVHFVFFSRWSLVTRRSLCSHDVPAGPGSSLSFNLFFIRFTNGATLPGISHARDKWCSTSWEELTQQFIIQLTAPLSQLWIMWSIILSSYLHDFISALLYCCMQQGGYWNIVPTYFTIN